MNNMKKLMAAMLACTMIVGVTGCSTSSNTEKEKTTETKTIGKKTDDSTKIKVFNKTDKGITVFESKSSSEEDYSENLLEDGDVFKKDAKRFLYEEIKEDDNLDIKVGFKDEDTSYTFEDIKTDDVKKVEIKIDENKDVVVDVTDKEDKTETIKPSETEEKSEEEKKNEEEADKEESKEESSKTEESSKKDTSNTTSKTDTSTKQESTSSNNNGSSSSSSSSSSNSSSSSSSSKTEQQHQHNWIAQYTTVHHDAVYTQQYVVDQAAYMQERAICSGCGADLTGTDAVAHSKAHALAGEKGGWHAEFVTVPEQGHYENVLVSNAYDEQVLSGYRCSSCGATK